MALASAPQRIVFPKGAQKRFLERACDKSKRDWSAVARLCRVHRRTLYDWRREKYTLSASALKAIQRSLGIRPPPSCLVDAYRHVRLAGRKGALSRYRRYGNPGTFEGRRKGGKATQHYFQWHPDEARSIGFVIRRPIQKPRHSAKLAEFIGVMLGDGHLGDYQSIVYFNSLTEQVFAGIVRRMVRSLFGITAPLRQHPRNCLWLVASSRELVEFLEQAGLRKGDKIQQRVAIPAWIFKQREYITACLRGLIDTDGGLFSHQHTTNGYRYRHMGLCFTSYSPVLLRGTYRLFRLLGYSPRLYKSAGHIFLYRRDQVVRYMATIGSRHPGRFARFKELLERSRSG